LTKFFEESSPGGRMYAVGDIHGCLEELEILLRFIQGCDLTEDDFVVFIGDYIDRGPDSKGCVDALIKFQSEVAARCIFLRGNHEDMLLDYLGFEGNGGPGYLANGGAECLKSYGASISASIEEIVTAIGQAHMDFYQSLERYAIIGDYVFAHAGLSPLRDLRFQLDDDLLWIREDFVENMHYFKKTVVFGHTPFQDVFFHLPYKIGIDTGLVYNNIFTTIELTEERVFQVYPGEPEVEESSFSEKGAVWPQY